MQLTLEKFMEKNSKSVADIVSETGLSKTLISDILRGTRTNFSQRIFDIFKKVYGLDLVLNTQISNYDAVKLDEDTDDSKKQIEEFGNNILKTLYQKDATIEVLKKKNSELENTIQELENEKTKENQEKENTNHILDLKNILIRALGLDNKTLINKKIEKAILNLEEAISGSNEDKPKPKSQPKVIANTDVQNVKKEKAPTNAEETEKESEVKTEEPIQTVEEKNQEDDSKKEEKYFNEIVESSLEETDEDFEENEPEEFLTDEEINNPLDNDTAEEDYSPDDDSAEDFEYDF